MISFRAPWATCLKVMTGLSIAILLGVPVIGLTMYARHHNAVHLLVMVALPLCMLIGSAFFLIRGYVLNDDTLLIQRLGWYSKLDLTDLISAEPDSSAMAKSIRTFGNGGLFCIAGAFWNKKLGHYRAFASDPPRAVILRFPERRVVITPDNPGEFVRRIKELRGPG